MMAPDEHMQVNKNAIFSYGYTYISKTNAPPILVLINGQKSPKIIWDCLLLLETQEEKES